MHMRCKFDDKKVINRSQSGSWGHRCEGAGLRLNLCHAWRPQTWTEMTKSQNTMYQAGTEAITKKQRKTEKEKQLIQPKIADGKVSIPRLTTQLQLAGLTAGMTMEAHQLM